MSGGYVICIPLLYPYNLAAKRRNILHIGVGFCVARSDWIGQCEGLCRAERVTSTDSRAFLYLCTKIILKNIPWGSLGKVMYMLMKRYVILLLMSCWASIIIGQDVIALKNGTTILCRVLEVGSKEIKYKKWTHQDGPLYTIEISEILSINYQNGEIEKFLNTPSIHSSNEISDQNLRRSKTLNVDLARRQDLLRSARRYKTSGVVLSICCFGGTIAWSIIDGFNGVIAGVGGALSILPAAILCTKGNSLKRQAYDIHTFNLYKHEFNIGKTIITPSMQLLSENSTNVLGIGCNIDF